MNVQQDRKLLIYTAAKIYAARPEDGYMNAVKGAVRLIETVDTTIDQLQLDLSRPGP